MIRVSKKLDQRSLRRISGRSKNVIEKRNVFVRVSGEMSVGLDASAVSDSVFSPLDMAYITSLNTNMLANRGREISLSLL